MCNIATLEWSILAWTLGVSGRMVEMMTVMERMESEI